MLKRKKRGGEGVGGDVNEKNLVTSTRDLQIAHFAEPSATSTSNHAILSACFGADSI